MSHLSACSCSHVSENKQHVELHFFHFPEPSIRLHAVVSFELFVVKAVKEEKEILALCLSCDVRRRSC